VRSRRNTTPKSGAPVGYLKQKPTGETVCPVAAGPPGARFTRCGADDRARTGDLLVGNEMLYQLSYVRMANSHDSKIGTTARHRDREASSRGRHRAQAP